MMQSMNHVKAYGLTIREFKAPKGSVYGYDAKSPYIVTKFPSPKYLGHKLKMYRWKFDVIADTGIWYETTESSDLTQEIINYIFMNKLVVTSFSVGGIVQSDIDKITPKAKRPQTSYIPKGIWTQNQLDRGSCYKDGDTIQEDGDFHDHFVTNDNNYWNTFSSKRPSFKGHMRSYSTNTMAKANK